ncbi:MAG: hypothetical protein D3923_19030, partial [Candidatus Electrothrix sp. AR3]|nr:hypothetical protein [Candidatus Electrothrix sp. AR3]
EQVATETDPGEHVCVVLPTQVSGKESVARQTDQHGFIRLEAGKNHEENRCGIEQSHSGDKEGQECFSHDMNFGV